MNIRLKIALVLGVLFLVSLGLVFNQYIAETQRSDALLNHIGVRENIPQSFISEVQQASERQLIINAASLLVILLIVYLFLEAWVERPLRALARGMRNQNIPLMQQMQDDHSEFGALAKLVLNFSGYEQAAQVKARNEAIISAVGSGLMAVDTNGTITLFNAAAESLFRRSSRAVVGLNIAEIFSAETPHGTPLSPDRYPLIRAMAERRLVAESLVCVRTDGSKFPAIITAAPVTSGNVIVGAVQDLRDITEEQMLEQTKSNFVSLVSHELRTPLTLLRWTIEKLKSRTDLPQDLQSSAIPPMESAVNRTLSLVSEMLNVSKIETNAFEITNTKVQMSTLIQKSLQELTPAIQDKHLTVDTHGVVESTTIVSDERLLQIIINNLLSNASRYAEPNGKISVRLSQAEDGNVILDVENTGPGIPAADQPYIFKKMFRGTSAQRQNPDGSGLGLYITKSFIQRLGGTISFMSIPDQSTTFTVRFPFRHGEIDKV